MHKLFLIKFLLLAINLELQQKSIFSILEETAFLHFQSAAKVSKWHNYNEVRT
jgi:hypothetical protein